jgi:hypothetical protein
MGQARRPAEEEKAATMKAIALSAGLLLALPLACLAQEATPELIKVQIEANQWNRAKLLEKLNQNGSKHRMKFLLTEEGYDYRIRFATGKTPEAIIVQGTGGTTNYDTGFATVYDAKGAELFQIKHEALWSEASAINGGAKEIVKRLEKMRAAAKKSK